MADVALLALGLDTSGVKKGSDEVTRALQQLQTQFDAMGRKVTELETKLKTVGSQSGQGFKNVSASGRDLSATLSGLGGPIGEVAGKMGGLVGQAQELSSSFGLVGGAALGAVAGVAALSASMVKLTLDGVKISDEMGDIAEGTGLTIEQVQRLGAAFKMSGESVGSVERSFRTFTSTVESARSGSKEAAEVLHRLGINAESASHDMGGAFISLITRLKEVRSTTEGMDASNTALGRGIGALTRSSDDLRKVMGENIETLRDWNVVAGEEGVQAGQQLDRQVNILSNSWDVFKQNLAASKVGDLIGGAFMVGNAVITEQISLLDIFIKTLQAGGNAAIGFGEAWAKAQAKANQARIESLGKDKGRPGEIRSEAEEARWLAAHPPAKPPGVRTPRGGSAEKPIDLAVDKGELRESLRATKEYYDGMRDVQKTFFSAQIVDIKAYNEQIKNLDEAQREANVANLKQMKADLERQLAQLTPGTANFKRVADVLADVNKEAAKAAAALGIQFVPALEDVTDKVKLAVGKGKLIAAPEGIFGKPGTLPGREGEPYNVGRTFSTRPREVIPISDETRPRRVVERAADKRSERMNQEFGFIFEDFIRVIITARQGVKEAFGGMLMGVMDLFADEFLRSFSESFIQPVVKSVSKILTDSLNDIFGGISAKGVGGFFSSLLKGLGKFFGGFFAEGGTLQPNKWGIVGERGPELIYSGSRPMQITPSLASGSASAVNVNIHIQSPDARSFEAGRTKDQISDSVYQALQRSNRNRGAR